MKFFHVMCLTKWWGKVRRKKNEVNSSATSMNDTLKINLFCKIQILSTISLRISKDLDLGVQTLNFT